MAELVLSESAEAVFGADGRATLSLGPIKYGQKWRITNTAVSSTSSNRTIVSVYRGTETPSRLVDGSRSGNQDFSDTVHELKNQEKLLFVWEGGTPNAVATAVVEGSIEDMREGQ